MSKRTIGFIAIVIAGLAFSLSASARYVGTIGVVLRPIVSPVGDEGSSDDAAEEEDCAVTDSGAVCWDA